LIVSSRAPHVFARPVAPISFVRWLRLRCWFTVVTLWTRLRCVCRLRSHRCVARLRSVLLFAFAFPFRCGYLRTLRLRYVLRSVGSFTDRLHYVTQLRFVPFLRCYVVTDVYLLFGYRYVVRYVFTVTRVTLLHVRLRYVVVYRLRYTFVVHFWLVGSRLLVTCCAFTFGCVTLPLPTRLGVCLRSLRLQVAPGYVSLAVLVWDYITHYTLRIPVPHYTLRSVLLVYLFACWLRATFPGCYVTLRYLPLRYVVPDFGLLHHLTP